MNEKEALPFRTVEMSLGFGKKKEKKRVLRRMIGITTHFVAFVLGILSTLILRGLKTWGIKKSVKSVLMSFATSWEELREEELHLSPKSKLVLQKGKDIERIVMSAPAILSNSDMIEALDIAHQLIDIEESVYKSPNIRRPFGQHKASIDKLAERARQCVAGLEWWSWKK